MTQISVRFRLRIVDQDRLYVESDPRRRIIFFILFLLLFVLFLVAADFRYDFTREKLAGNLFYFGMMLICLSVAGWNNRYTLDRTKGTVVRSLSIFFIILVRQSELLKLKDLEKIILQEVRLFTRERNDDVPDAKRSSLSNKARLFKLYFETQESRYPLEDSTNQAAISELGQEISKFLGVPFEIEQI